MESAFACVLELCCPWFCVRHSSLEISDDFMVGPEEEEFPEVLAVEDVLPEKRVNVLDRIFAIAYL